jgi:hypothetical protein
VFGLGGLQLDREQEEAEDTDNEMELSVPDQMSVVLPATPSHQLLPPSILPPKPLFRQSQELYTQLSGGVSLWEAGKQGPPAIIPVHIPDVTYHPVVLDEWEDRIIWEPTEEEGYIYHSFHIITNTRTVTLSAYLPSL